MMVQIAKIKITNRVRKEIAKIAELSEDIRANGLINPITVMSLTSGEHEYQLLAGLRRLRATEMLGHNEIAVNIVTPADAEAMLRIEISENEQREPFTFSEQVDYGRMLEDIIKAKAQERMLSGKRSDDTDPVNHGAEGQGRSRDIIGSKIGMSGMQYDRAKYIAENAPPEVIEELDKGERSIRSVYDELKTKEKAAKATSVVIEEDEESIVQEDFHDDSQDDTSIPADTAVTVEADADVKPEPKPAKNSDKPKPSPPKSSTTSTSKPPSQEKINSLLSKADLEAIQRNNEFHAMSDAEKVEELERRLKKEGKRAAIAETELARLKDVHHNAVYHKDSIIKNLQARLDMAEARVAELEALHGSNSKGE